MDETVGRTHCRGCSQRLAGTGISGGLFHFGAEFNRTDLSISHHLGLSLPRMRFDTCLYLYSDWKMERGGAVECNRIFMVAVSVRVMLFPICSGKKNAAADASAYRDLQCYSDLVGGSMAGRIMRKRIIMKV